MKIGLLVYSTIVKSLFMQTDLHPKSLLIAGVHSGVGKTTITTGLIVALCKRGLNVQPFKVGPDYIDPGFLSLAAGKPCYNLDTWMTSSEKVVELFSYRSASADITVIEGMMGLFDGQNYCDDSGSTAEVAKLTHTPVILVIDAHSLARSAVAIALGYRNFDPRLKLAGFILNYVGGDAHGRSLAEAIESASGLPVLGWLPRDPSVVLPERHLGLVPTAENAALHDFFDSSGRHVSEHLDIDRILHIAASTPPISPAPQAISATRQFAFAGRPSPVIAVARDEAFNFIYPENIDLLQSAGAQIAYFSPIHDCDLPQGAQGILLSGGFPEIYAPLISSNGSMRDAIRSAFRRNLPIYAECGGLMVLTRSITDLQGREFPMVDILPGRSVMTTQLQIGYRIARAAGDSWLMKKGEEVHGHEFHYSVTVDRPDVPPYVFDLLSVDGRGAPKPEGFISGSLWASYVHLSFLAFPELARRFAAACFSSNPY